MRWKPERDVAGQQLRTRLSLAVLPPTPLPSFAPCPPRRSQEGTYRLHTGLAPTLALGRLFRGLRRERIGCPHGDGTCTRVSGADPVQSPLELSRHLCSSGTPREPWQPATESLVADGGIAFSGPRGAAAPWARPSVLRPILTSGPIGGGRGWKGVPPHGRLHLGRSDGPSSWLVAWGADVGFPASASSAGIPFGNMRPTPAHCLSSPVCPVWRRASWQP